MIAAIAPLTAEELFQHVSPEHKGKSVFLDGWLQPVSVFSLWISHSQITRSLSMMNGTVSS